MKENTTAQIHKLLAKAHEICYETYMELAQLEEEEAEAKFSNNNKKEGDKLSPP